MNRYYNELQNKLTDRIRVTIAEMNNNVFELSEENKELQQRINKAIEIIKREFLCYDNESDEYKWGKILLSILGDKENE